MWMNQIVYGGNDNWIGGPGKPGVLLTLQQAGVWTATGFPLMCLMVLWTDGWIRYGKTAMLRYGRMRRWWLCAELENGMLMAFYLISLLLLSNSEKSFSGRTEAFFVLFVHFLFLEHLVLFLRLRGSEWAYAVSIVFLAEGTGIYIFSEYDQAAVLFPGYWGMWNYCSRSGLSGYHMETVFLLQAAVTVLILYDTLRKRRIERLL